MEEAPTIRLLNMHRILATQSSYRACYRTFKQILEWDKTILAVKILRKSMRF